MAHIRERGTEGKLGAGGENWVMREREIIVAPRRILITMVLKGIS